MSTAHPTQYIARHAKTLLLLRAPHLLAAATLVRNRPSPRIRRLLARAPLPRLRSKMADWNVDARQLMLQAGVLGSGVLSGLYFIFSSCVMNALNMQPPASAISTMNAINRVIVNPPFMVVFMGTPLVCALLLRSCLKEGLGTSLDNKCTTAGALALLVGEFLLTLVVHIPKNDALAAHTLGGASDLSVWAEYFTTWTAWNHVRMLASVAAMALFSTGLHLRAMRLAAVRPTQMH